MLLPRAVAYWAFREHGRDSRSLQPPADFATVQPIKSIKRKRVVMTRYIFITGGVVSSLGKGIASASLGTILEARGFKVNLLKLDP